MLKNTKDTQTHTCTRVPVTNRRRAVSIYYILYYILITIKDKLKKPRTIICLTILLLFGLNIFLVLQINNLKQENINIQNKVYEYQNMSSTTNQDDILNTLAVDTSTQPQGYIITNDEYILLCKLVYAEANISSQETKEAVAQVVINRLNSPNFPNTIHDVIYAYRQFAPTYDGSLEKAILTADVQTAVDKVLNGETSIPSNVCFFWLPSCVNIDAWFQSKHKNDFYKDIGGTYFYYE